MNNNRARSASTSERVLRKQIVTRYDGQTVEVEGGTADPYLELGNYLGGGAAGVVYEAIHVESNKVVALKILNPLGYKLMPSGSLKRCSIAVKGAPLDDELRAGKRKMTQEHVWWLVHPSSKQLVAACEDPRTGSIKELNLVKCVELWGWEPPEAKVGRGSSNSSSSSSNAEDSSAEAQAAATAQGTAAAAAAAAADADDGGRSEKMRKMAFAAAAGASSSAVAVAATSPAPPGTTTVGSQVRVGADTVVTIPRVSPKFLKFVAARRSVFREIVNMWQLAPHPNVLKFEEVLELVQASKTTIFLLLELASGGELFDRIQIDHGTAEATARTYLVQLLAGMQHCHAAGVCHRDLKPENLLLADGGASAVLKIADFGLSAMFAAQEAAAVGTATPASPALGPMRSPPFTPDSLDAGAMTSPPLLPLSIGGLPDEQTPTTTRHASRQARQNQETEQQQQQQQQQQQEEEDQHHHHHHHQQQQQQQQQQQLAPQQLLRLTSVVGSPHYVAPEVLEDSSVGYDGTSADCWSIGVILYAMLAGNLPFGKDLLHCPRFVKFRKWALKRASGVLVDFPLWFFPAHFSAEAKELLSALLHPVPAQRITIAAAAEHPFTTAGAAGAGGAAAVLPDGAGEEDEVVAGDDEEDDEGGEEEEEEEEEDGDVDAGADAEKQLQGDAEVMSGAAAATSAAAPSAATVAVLPPLIPSMSDLTLQDGGMGGTGTPAPAAAGDALRVRIDSPPATALTAVHEAQAPTALGSMLACVPALEDCNGGGGDTPPIFRSMGQPSMGGGGGGGGGGGAAAQHGGASGGGASGGGGGGAGRTPPATPPRGGAAARSAQHAQVARTREQGREQGHSSAGTPAAGTSGGASGAGGAGELHMFHSPPLLPQSAQLGGVDDLDAFSLDEQPPDLCLPSFERQGSWCGRNNHRGGSGGHDVADGNAHLFASKTTECAPPSFTDIVKRSTRFSTAVPASEVLLKIEEILLQNPYPLPKPFSNVPQRVNVKWDEYKLEVLHGGILICTVQIYLMRNGLYMVEFKRGHFDIFQFKRFYEDIREKLSNVVKHDEKLQLLAGSSTRPSPKFRSSMLR